MNEEKHQRAKQSKGITQVEEITEIIETKVCLQCRN